MRFLLDSVIVIDHFNGIEEATSFLAAHGGESALSVITRAEVLTGFEERQASLATDLLDVFTTLPITIDIADTAARLRRSDRWKLPDAMQAALAITHNLTLVTRNTRDFQPGRSPDVLTPYQV